MTNTARLRGHIQAMTRLADRNPGEATWLKEGEALLADLIRHDDWLPEALAEPGPVYRQYLLHCDLLERFCVVSFVWGPGQRTPVHDHTVWGLIGVLRGAERCEEFEPQGTTVRSCGREHVMQAGDIEAVSPTLGDWHRVSNALADRPSISIHVYGANIGAVRRHRLDDEGRVLDFVSGYDSVVVPNLWDRSAAVRSGAC